MASQKPTGKATARKAAAARRNGRKGGRPRESRPRGTGRDAVSWVQIRAYARLGADKADILIALGVDPGKLAADAAFAEAFESEMRRGQALLRIDLLRDHKRLRGGGDGSVNAVQSGLRQVLGWGRPDTGRGNKRPDDDAAIADAAAIIAKVGG